MPAMEDARFRELLGVTPGATAEEIRRAWRRRVMENHPDRFPPDAKSIQELRIITLNEAYAFLMGAPREPVDEDSGPAVPAGRATDGRASPGTAVAGHKDPGYAYYKQGFLRFSFAVHGIAELNQAIAREQQESFRPRYEAAREFASSLRLLGEAHSYFARVVDQYPGSVWCADARYKLKRIERFTRLYRRILVNLRGGHAAEPEAAGAP